MIGLEGGVKGEAPLDFSVIIDNLYSPYFCLGPYNHQYWWPYTKRHLPDNLDINWCWAEDIGRYEECSTYGTSIKLNNGINCVIRFTNLRFMAGEDYGNSEKPEKELKFDR
jgi:hypothetical protein